MRDSLFLCLLALSTALPTTAWCGDVPRKAYAASNLDAKRFAGSDVSAVAIAAGSEVEVISEVGAQVRVRYQTSFGWVAASDISDRAPVAADTVELDLKGPPSFR